jgi:serine/threonine protein phosphatase PrpC
MRVGGYAGVSDPGRKRRRNEDAFVVSPPVFAVADGMGGPRAGEVASGLAAGAVEADEDAGRDGETRVVELIREANRRVYERSTGDESVSGMGTTMTVAVVGGDGVSIGHVGDSRAYLARDGALRQLTDDHSLVAELVRGGKLSPEEAEQHPQRSVITRALGTDPDVDVDVFTVAPHEGDVFLLCSDGLTTMLSDAAILRVLAEQRDLNRAAKELVRLANRAGGDDNITVVAFAVTDAREAEQPEIEQTTPMPSIEDEDEDEQTLDESDGVPVVAASATAPPPETRSRLPFVIAGIAVAVIVAVVVVWLLFL